MNYRKRELELLKYNINISVLEYFEKCITYLYICDIKLNIKIFDVT